MGVYSLLKIFVTTLFKKPLLILWAPFLLLTIVGVFVIPEQSYFIKECVAFGLLTLALSLVQIALSKTTINKLVQFIIFAILVLLVFIKLSFYIYYGVQLSASALYVIFETNTEEATGFLEAYFSSNNIVLLCISLCLLAIPFLIKKENLKTTPIIRIASLGLACVLFLCVGWKLKDENLALKSISVYKEYQQTKTLIKSELAQQKSAILKGVFSQEQEQTYVCVIGESTSNWHMQLYNYHRETNPLLSSIKDQLVIFNDVIAPNVHTIVSLDKILTLSNQKAPNKKKNASIIQLANAAGFETYWISNQRPVGIHESIPTIIGSAAKETYFTATNDYGDINHDEKILPVLKKVLEKKAKKKLIFIQLIGTHVTYKNRYPESFNILHGGNIKSPYNDRDDVKLVIDQYDNAIRYNDYVLYNIIDLVSKKNTSSYVSYFSDHGDELYDTMDLKGHNEYHGTKPMYEVPFFVWFSKKYKEENPRYISFKEHTNKKYNLEDFIYTFADISNISFKGNDTTRSVFNKNFTPRPRLIKKGINYDTK